MRVRTRVFAMILVIALALSLVPGGQLEYPARAAELSRPGGQVGCGCSAQVPQFPVLMAGSLLAMVPMVILYLLFQKQFIEGIAMTGGK